jgi:hypothetical protein
MAYGHCYGLGTGPFLVGNHQKDNFSEKNLSSIPLFSNKNIAKICPNSFLRRVSPHSCLLAIITGHYFNGPLQKCHQLRRKSSEMQNSFLKTEYSATKSPFLEKNKFD